MVFTISGHGGHLEFRVKTILAFFLAPIPGGYIRNLVTVGLVVSKKESFESMDVRRTDDEASHPISSPGAFGLGKLIKKEQCPKQYSLT